MIIQTLIKLVDVPELLSHEFDTLKSVDLGACEIDGLSAIKYQIGVIHKDTPIEKLLVALNTPATSFKKYKTDMIPKGVLLSQTKDLDYSGTTRTTDTSAKIRSLMNSDTSEDINRTCIDLFAEITERMDIINAHFKTNMPFNAEKQGFIKHHFPSPVFKSTGEELAKEVKEAEKQAEEIKND